MLGLAIVVLSIGLADSLNPSTIAPALVLATGKRSGARVAAFSAGVFGVSFLLGVVIVLGPGQLLLNAIPHPNRHTKHLLELIGGGVLLAAAAVLWLGRAKVDDRIARRGVAGGPGSAFVLGAGIMAVELPTAAPYFAALTTIIASRRSPQAQLVMVLLFNVAFVSPLLLILAVRAMAGESVVPKLEATAEWLRIRAVLLLTGLLAVLGTGLVAIGLSGLV